jgi:transposase
MTKRNIDAKNRVIIVELKKEGYTTASIKEIMLSRHEINVSKRGIQKIIKKYDTTGLYEDKKRSGRPDKLSERSRRIIRLMSLRNRALSVRSITSNFNIQGTEHVSRDTVSKILIKYGLRSYRPSRKPFITLKQRRGRIEWARSKRHWDNNKWAQVVFSDESMFQIFGQRSSHRIRRFNYERYSPICTRKVIGHGTQVHVWGCFSRYGVGILKRIRGNINSTVYQDVLINDIELIGKCLVFPERNFIFQHDNAPCHRSASTVSFLEDHNICLLDWPANSPDANPIENLWHIIKSKITTLGLLNAEELWSEIQNIWYNIPSTICRNLVDSMPRRVANILKMKGFATKY